MQIPKVGHKEDLLVNTNTRRRRRPPEVNIRTKCHIVVPYIEGYGREPKEDLQKTWSRHAF